MNKNQIFIRSFIILTLGLVATLMIFLPALSYSDSDTSFTGFQAVFGTEFFDLGAFGSGEITFSILGIIAFLAPLSASLIAVFFKKGMLMASLLFALSAVLLFTLPAYTTTTISVFGTVTEIDISFAMAYGLIIAAVLAIIGAVFTMSTVLYKPATT